MTKKTLPEPVEALVLTLMVFSGIVLLALTMGSAASSVSAEGELETLITIFYLYSKSLFIIVPFYYARKKGYTINKLFRFNPVSGQTIFLAIILAVSLFIITDEIDRLISALIPPPDAIKEMMKPLQINTVLQWIFIIAGSVFVAAIAEESLFRGFLQVTLESKGDPTRAIILTSVTWAIVHLNPYWAIPVFVLGVFIGFVAWKTRSIWPAITIHATYNFLSLLIGNEAMLDNMSWYTMGNHISPVVLVIAVAGLYYSIKNLDGYKGVTAAAQPTEHIGD
jgi:membrane protease YdiL (CAAX protease family)